MIFQDFRKIFYELGCFSSGQVYTWKPGFDKNNLGRWVKKGLLIRLRQGWYAFPEYIGKAGFELYIANRIYRPSYVSLHTALAFYGLIPEAVIQISSVTSMKTLTFSNPFGTYSYKTLKPDLFFGYDLKPVTGDRSIQIATLEKALLDLLYLYPFYNTISEMEALRLDEDLMHENLDFGKMMDFLSKFENSQLEKRIKLLQNIYLE